MDVLVDYAAWARALAGGLMIGASAVLLMAAQGRIAGISGVLGGLFNGQGFSQGGWRVMFVVGLLAGALLVQVLTGQPVTTVIPASLGIVVLAGLLVGVGTRMGNGCTSGHGVCGLGRRSPRSLAATMTFMGVAVATVFIVRHVIGG